MDKNLKSAIIHFLANEFKLDPSSIDMELNFEIDLSLTPDEVLDLVQRLQDSLNFSLPEGQTSSIQTIYDLLHAVDPDLENEE